MRKLYFAHPRLLYGTQREKVMLSRIRKVFVGVEIINPGAPKFQRKMSYLIDSYMTKDEYMIPFFQIIDECNSVVFYTLESGKVGIGTLMEVRHAEENEIPVYTWDGIRFTTDYKLVECHTHGAKIDWKDNYARIEI